MTLEYAMLFMTDEDGNINVSFPDLPGCNTWGMSEGDYSEESFPDINPHARRTEIGRMSSRYIPKVGDPYGKEAVKDKNSEVRIIRPAKSKENEN